MLSPVGSTPQYKEIDFSLVSLRNPSASVCWLIASRHSNSSIMFILTTPLSFYCNKKAPSSAVQTKGRCLPCYHPICIVCYYATLSEISFASSAWHYPSTPECNSQSLHVSGSINP